MKYHTLFFRKLGKMAFVVCLSCDWRLRVDVHANAKVYLHAVGAIDWICHPLFLDFVARKRVFYVCDWLLRLDPVCIATVTRLNIEILYVAS